MAQKLRIFVSSPGDVGQERLIATRVIERLQGEFAGYVDLEAILWEHEPLRATAHFQEQIIPPSETDIVVCILWSRLGTRLPGQFQREDGSFYASGTEWEFEDALKSFQARGTPDLMVYRKTAEPRASMSDEDALMQRLQQKKALDLFIDHWFGNAKDTFRAAFHTFDAPDAFETVLEAHLRRLIREKLPAHLMEEGEAATPIQWYKGSPFRGLEVFDVEHAPVFFGRTRAISSIKEALSQQAARGCAFVLVFGMSGCGKSSLVRAGVIPTITQPGIIEGIGVWRWCAFRPTDAPEDLFGGLAYALLSQSALPELAAIGYDAGELAALLRESPSRAVGALQMGIRRIVEAVALAEGRAEPPQARIVVMVDQLEEIFTQPQLTPAEREGFTAALNELARSGLVWVIATMRSDFYPRCAEIPQLSALKEGEGQFDVLPASFAEIGQMIRYPARAAGLRFEVRRETGEKLDELLHEAAFRDPEALPLLEFTLDQLFQERTENNLLTFAAYERLGGLEGALAQRAEEVFTAQDVSVQAVLPSLLRGLVTVGKSGEELVAARRVPLESLSATPEHKALLDAFIGARLLVTDRDDTGVAVVRVAHEALLRRWPRLQDWLAEDKSFLQTRERVAASALRWREEGRRAEYLLPEGKPLADALDMLQQRRSELDLETIAYTEASQHAVASARRRTLRLAFGVAAAFCAVVLGFGIFSYSQWQRSERQKKLALRAVNKLTYDVPRRLIELPGSRPVLRGIFEDNLTLLDQIADSQAQAEKRINHQYMGDMWFLFGDITRARKAYEQSLRLAEEEVRQRPTVGAKQALAACRTRIGDVLLKGGDPKGALAYYQQAREALEALQATAKTGAVTHDLSVALEKVGDSKSALKDMSGALEAYQQSLALAQLSSDQATPKTLRELAVSYTKLGDARFATSNLESAREAFQTSLKLLLSLKGEQELPQVRRGLLASYTRLGDVALQSGNLSQAQDAYEKSMALAQGLAKDTTDRQAQRDLSACYASFIGLRLAQSDPKAARAACLQSLVLAERVASDKSDVLARSNLKYLYERLRDICFLQGDQKGGMEAQERSLLLAIELGQLSKASSARRELATLYQSLGVTRTEKGDTKGALDAYSQALDLYQEVDEKKGNAP